MESVVNNAFRGAGVPLGAFWRERGIRFHTGASESKIKLLAVPKGVAGLLSGSA
jgi:hypothetical protein